MSEAATPLRVHFLMLTDTLASEHMYCRRLQGAMADREIEFVDDWRDADVVHLFEVNFFTRAAVRAFNFPELFRLLRSDVPVVVSTDDLYFTSDPSLTSRPRLYSLNSQVQQWLLNHCDAVIAISNSVRDALEPHVSDASIHVVHHGVDERYYVDDEDSTDPFVLHVSLAAPRKNPEAIVEVAERLDERFVVAGSGWEQHVPDGPPTENVEIAGFVSDEELLDLYASASVFYFPTLHEGFGLPVLEAMAAKNAIVTSDVYSVPEITGDAAVLHGPRDVDAHLDSLRGLLADRERRERLAAAARGRSREFTWEESARRTERIYRSVVESRRSRPVPGRVD